jgi:hypothetical protein
VSATPSTTGCGYLQAPDRPRSLGRDVLGGGEATGVVDQQVDADVAPERSLDQGTHVLLVADVTHRGRVDTAV